MKLYPHQLDNHLTLRSLVAADAEKFFAFITQNRSYLDEYDPFASEFRTVQDTQEKLSTIERAAKKGTRLTCGIWESDKLVGYLTCVLDPKEKSAQLGYGLAQDYQGRGIITRSARVVLGYAFDQLGIQYAWLRVGPDNIRSVHVAERLGFSRQDKSTAAVLHKGKLHDRYRYILRRPTPDR